jgi:hypothetical protein
VTDVEYQVIYDYLSSKKYPDKCDENKNRSIRRKAQKFSLKNGVLFYSSKAECEKEWIPDKQRQQQNIQASHGDKLGGHFGRDKTREKITTRLT